MRKANKRLKAWIIVFSIITIVFGGLSFLLLKSAPWSYEGDSLDNLAKNFGFFFGGVSFVSLLILLNRIMKLTK